MGVRESDSCPRGYRTIGPRGLERNLNNRAQVYSSTKAAEFGYLDFNADGEFFLRTDSKRKMPIEPGDIVRIQTPRYQFGSSYIYEDDSD